LIHGNEKSDGRDAGDDIKKGQKTSSRTTSVDSRDLAEHADAAETLTSSILESS